MSWRRNGSAKYGRASSSSTHASRGSGASPNRSVRPRRRNPAPPGPSARPSTCPRPSPNRACRPAIDTESGHSGATRVRVGLQRQHPAQRARRGLAEPVDQRGVDLAGQQLDVGLVQRPRGVHLDVRLVDRRHRADRVDRRDERKGAAGKVVRRSGAPEADVGLLAARVRRRARWKHGISISTPLVVPSVRRTWGACAKPTTAMSVIGKSLYRWCL